MIATSPPTLTPSSELPKHCSEVRLARVVARVVVVVTPVSRGGLPSDMVTNYRLI